MSEAPASVARDDWDAHWTTYEASNAANPAQAYRRKLVFAKLNLDGAQAPKRVLEVGSGSGVLSREIVDRHPDVELVGIDISRAAVESARKKIARARFYQRDLTRDVAIPPELAGWATHAVCSEVLEHLDDPAAALRRLREYLAPGARLVITVPAGPMSAFDRHIGHRRHFTAALLHQTLEDAGYTVLEARGAGFPFFNLYRLAVIARGEKLIEDAAGGDSASLPFAARAASQLFSWLFRLNSAATMRGWQLVAAATPSS
jgi:SAM-dependent methyltransferase